MLADSRNWSGFSGNHTETWASIISCNLAGGNRPTCVSTTSPPLNTTSVGNMVTPYLAAKDIFELTSTFTILAFPSLSVANCSITGPSFRQGPHVGAQKSTSTGVSDSSTSASNVSSLSSSAIFFHRWIKYRVPAGLDFQSGSTVVYSKGF